MDTTLSRLLVWPMLIISALLWLGVSVDTVDAVNTLVKSNFDFTRSFGSVSSKTLVSALVWPPVIGVWLGAYTSLGMKNFVFGACAVAAWAIGLLVLTAIGIDLLWGFRRVLIGFGLLALSSEVIVAVWLLRLTIQSLSFGVGLIGVLSSIVVALNLITATKAAFLWLVPGVSIRM